MPDSFPRSTPSTPRPRRRISAKYRLPADVADELTVVTLSLCRCGSVTNCRSQFYSGPSCDRWIDHTKGFDDQCMVSAQPVPHAASARPAADTIPSPAAAHCRQLVRWPLLITGLMIIGWSCDSGMRMIPAATPYAATLRIQASGCRLFAHASANASATLAPTPHGWDDPSWPCELPSRTELCLYGVCPGGVRQGQLDLVPPTPGAIIELVLADRLSRIR
jgi:hypothetical protein